MKRDVYLPLIYKSLEGKLSAREQQELRDWLTADQANQHIHDEVAQSFAFEKSYEPAIDVDVKADFLQLKKRIKQADQATSTPQAKVHQLGSMRRNFAIAASLLLLLTAAWWLFPTASPSAPTLLTASTGDNERREVILSDGTSVWLNANSQLAYAETFASDKRAIQLIGEGFFEVTHNPAAPFTIQTAAGLEVAVLGTSFNLLARTTERVELQVTTGLVAMRDVAQNQEQKVSAGNAVGWNKTDRSFEKLATSTNIKAWQTQSLRFEATPLPMVLADAERLLGVNFLLDKISPLHQCVFTGYLPQVTPDKFISALQDSFRFQWTRHGDDFLIKGGSCE